MSDPIKVRQLVEQSAGSTEQSRQKLNKKKHFIPLNIKALRISLGHILSLKQEDVPEEDKWRAEFLVTSFKKLQQSIFSYLSSRHPNKINLQGDKFLIGATEYNYTEIDKFLPAVVYQNNSIVGVLYSSFESSRNFLFKEFLNKEISQFIKDAAYKNTVGKDGEPLKFKKEFDVGHIFNINGDLSSTPLGEKFKRLLAALNSVSDGTFEINGVAIPAQNTAEMEKARTAINAALNTLAEKSHYGPRIEATLTKETGDFLLAVGANIVIIQDRLENQYNYGTLFEGPLANKVIAALFEANFSRNIPEEIEYRVVSVLKGNKVSGKKTALKKLPVIQIKKLVKNVDSTKSTRSKTAVQKVKAQVLQETINLVQLQNLINQGLIQQVKRNMGTGDRRDILNLRTGRFAESVKVERMSQSREGMITAFYSYMKNPYATFSTGGLQGSPKTRDPKLLIAKSIRELAAQQVQNRLRSVVV